MTLPIENEASGGPSGTRLAADISGASRRAGKAAGAFRTISEVATDLNVPQHVLRFWETRFAQIRPLKRAGGRRYYRPEDVELLRRIRQLLYNNGYTIKGVQRLLRDLGRQEGARPESAPRTSDRRVESEGAAADLDVAAAAPAERHALEAEVEAERAPPASLGRMAIETALGDLEEVREMLRKIRR